MQVDLRTNDVRQVIVSLEYLIKREFDPVLRHSLEQKLERYRAQLHSIEMGIAANE